MLNCSIVLDDEKAFNFLGDGAWSENNSLDGEALLPLPRTYFFFIEKKSSTMTRMSLECVHQWSSILFFVANLSPHTRRFLVGAVHINGVLITYSCTCHSTEGRHKSSGCSNDALYSCSPLITWTKSIKKLLLAIVVAK